MENDIKNKKIVSRIKMLENVCPKELALDSTKQPFRRLDQMPIRKFYNDKLKVVIEKNR